MIENLSSLGPKGHLMMPPQGVVLKTQIINNVGLMWKLAVYVIHELDQIQSYNPRWRFLDMIYKLLINLDPKL